MKVIHFILSTLIFLLLIQENLSIFDPSKIVTKPQTKKEDLSVSPTKPTVNTNTKNETDTKTPTKPPMKREFLVWPAFTLNSTSSDSTDNVARKAAYPSKQLHPEKPAPVENQQEDEYWNRNGWTQSEPCPNKATGQFPCPGDCRKFYNCWKGRGILQVCSPGTLFNPDTLECDYPSKVRCLETTSHFNPVPVVNNAPNLSGGFQPDNSPYLQHGSDKPRQFFQPHTTRDGSQHAGVQPPNHGLLTQDNPYDRQYPVVEMPPEELSGQESVRSDHFLPGQQSNHDQHHPHFYNHYHPRHHHNHHPHDHKHSRIHDHHQRSGSPFIWPDQPQHSTSFGQNNEFQPNNQDVNPNVRPGVVQPYPNSQNNQRAYNPSQSFPSYSSQNPNPSSDLQPPHSNSHGPPFQEKFPSESQQTSTKLFVPNPYINNPSHTSNPTEPEKYNPYNQNPYNNPSNPPSNSGNPYDPFNPSNPRNPSSNSGNPYNPFNPLNPSNPPSNSRNPYNPFNPSNPSYPPRNSEDSYNPFNPPNPGNLPNNSGNPYNPFNPSNPSNPPSNSGGPFNPSNPRNPSSNSGNPYNPFNPSPYNPQSGNPYNPNNPGNQTPQNSRDQHSPRYPNTSPSTFEPRTIDGYPNANSYNPPQAGSSKAGTQNSENAKCPPGHTGLLPHPTDCKKFLNCHIGRTFVQDCGPGTAFNPAISVCDYPGNVRSCQQNTGSGGGKNQNGNNQQSEDIDGEESRYPTGTPSAPLTYIDSIDVRMGNPNNKSIQSQSPRSQPPQLAPPNPTPFKPLFFPGQKVEPVPQQSFRAGQDAKKPQVKPTLQNSDSPNLRHPYIPGFYIVSNVTSTPSPQRLANGGEPIAEPSNLEPKALSHTAKMPTTKAPVSRQLVRLRGGKTPNEGFLEMQVSSPGWGIVCDKDNAWTMQEANIACKQLGYKRGAELTWQGRPSEGDILSLRTVAADKVECTGKEHSLIDCELKKDSTCDPERESVWIRCYSNGLSQCQPGETSFDDKCYQLVIPREDKKDDTVGFSQGEALAHCQKRGGHLLDLNSQKENDYISEWLINQKSVSSVMTAGVGLSVLGRSLWIWEGSADALEYHNWWPGWGQTKTPPPKTQTGRGLCIVAKHMFSCPGSADQKSKVETSLCDSEYFFWDAEDCGIMSAKHPYVCERKADKIGCIIGRGEDYRGPANVTETGTECLSWDSDIVLPALQYRISEAMRRSVLTNNNNCRNVGGSDNRPWCYVRTATGIKKEYCDIPACSVQGPVGKAANEDAFKCAEDQFTCAVNECIPSNWVCDGQPDCINGLDEANCKGKDLKQFKKHNSARLKGHDVEKWLRTSISDCAKRCLQAKSFVCHSFSHSSENQTCLLSDSNIGLSGLLEGNETKWDYYELKSLSVDCTNMYVCDNNKCINTTFVCDGHNDCGDRADEKNCPHIDNGYEIRLVGGSKPNEGRVEIKVLGHWGVVCDDMFGMRDADVICRELGFSLGASEVKLHSTYNSTDKNPLFLVDDLECRGNETSIRECEFNGWGVHDCGPEEVVGVVCQVSGDVCPPNYWQCQESHECIPVAFLCDNVPDCSKGCDENKDRCNMGVEVRLVGDGRSLNKNVLAGRLEVKRFGIWGTVCDDDFGQKEAAVVCKSLGFEGEAEAKKEAAFGAGEGIIWLDQVHCNGSEAGVDKCLHQQWGKSNCKHDEDVAVICSKGPKRNSRPPSKPVIKSINQNDLTTDALPKECGKLDENLDILSSDFTAKVVAGYEIQKGTFPWQASIRVRTSTKSVHWCGAVVITPLYILTAGHCLLDYNKDVYFVRVGDHDSELDEGTEQEGDIEEIYLHEDFDKGPHLNNDLAIIKLKGRGLVLNTWVRPVCLPPKGANYNPGLNCTISGWGSNGSPGAGYSRRLHATWAPILKQEECTADYVYGSNAISNGMFCAGNLEGGPDSCQGDSGGPFICNHKDRFTLFGVTSWGHGCGRTNKPGVYTKLASYLDWINKKLQESLSGR